MNLEKTSDKTTPSMAMDNEFDIRSSYRTLWCGKPCIIGIVALFSAVALIVVLSG